MRNFIPGIDDEYIFTRPEFAKLVGLSTNALRMRMRRGQYGDYYVLKDKKFLFKRPGAMQVDRPPSDHVSMSSQPDPLAMHHKPRKKVNRGNHWEAVKNGSYKTKSQELHNTMKIRARCDGLLDEETLELLPEAMEKAKQEKRKRIQNALNETNQSQKKPSTSLRPYDMGIYSMSNKGYGTTGYFNGSGQSFNANKKGRQKESTEGDTSWGKFYW